MMGGVMMGGKFGGGGKGGMGMMGGGPMGGRGPMGYPPSGSSGSRVGDNDAVTYSKKLGSGAFAVCYEGKYKGERVAAKTTDCPEGFPNWEITLLRKAQGPHVVKLLGVEDRTKHGDSDLSRLFPPPRREQTPAAWKRVVRGTCWIPLGM